jgi:hypothetical protein
MKKILAYTVWLMFWWPQPWLALWFGGRFVNYFMMGHIVAITVTIAGWQLLWSEKYRSMDS